MFEVAPWSRQAWGREAFPLGSPALLVALFHQLQNYLDIARVVNIVFMHALPGSRPAIFVEGNILVGNQARNIVPFFL